MKYSDDTIENRNRLWLVEQRLVEQWLVEQWLNVQRLPAPPNCVQLTVGVLYIC
jgi:hypothetical protein